MKLPFGFEIRKKALIASPSITILKRDSPAIFTKANQESYVQDGFKKNPNVFSIVSLIARECAKARFLLYEYKGGKKIKVPEHDIYTLIDRPNPLQGRSEFIESLIAFKLICGNSYLHMAFPDLGMNAGIPLELSVLFPTLIDKIEFVNGLPANYIYKNTYRGQKVPAAEIIHFKYFNPTPGSGGFGMSPIQAGLAPVTESNEQGEQSVKMLQNGGPPGFLSVADSNVELLEPQALKIEEDINKNKYND